MKLMEKVKKFLNFKKKKQQRELDKLRQFIYKLSIKAKGLKKRRELQKHGAKREQYEKEYKAVKKLLKKSRKRLVKLLCEAE